MLNAHKNGKDRVPANQLVPRPYSKAIQVVLDPQ